MDEKGRLASIGAPECVERLCESAPRIAVVWLSVSSECVHALSQMRRRLGQASSREDGLFWM
eukprot:5067602-Pleurochrysis_carterae.AAC.1